jgi:site-specific recombinase XerD
MSGGSPTPLIFNEKIRPYVDCEDRFVAEDFPDSFDHSGLSFCHDEYRYVLGFLYQYRGSLATLRNYTKELERFLAWAWQYKSKSIFKMKRQDALEYLEFFVAPPSHWISISVQKKSLANGEINKKWRPFVSKNVNYSASNAARISAFTIMKTFYDCSVNESKTEINPFSAIRQKSAFISTSRTKNRVTHKLTDLQWQYLIETLTMRANRKDIPLHIQTEYERSLFIVTCMLGMYLRISDLVPRKDHLTGNEDIPVMKDFFRMENGWWFQARGKGNVIREPAVSNDVLLSLKRWRNFRGFSTALPTPADTECLFPSVRGNRPIRSTQQIANIVKDAFNLTADRMKKDDLQDEVGELLAASAHWLRHTGISQDVKLRPREHVREDAGHSSSLTTDKYIDDDLRERNESAKYKSITLDTD